MGISKSAASLWLRDIKLSQQAKKRIDDLGIRGRMMAVATNRGKREVRDAIVSGKVNNYFKNAKIDSRVAFSFAYLEILLILTKKI